jgi:murein DD-endopeptidase MepM/ murein hydrolase activator NlpD
MSPENGQFIFRSNTMAVYPLPIIEEQNYHYGGIRFGASRDDGARTHAGCDLIAPPGTPVYAVAGGTVVQVPKKAFFQNTYTVVIEHSGFTIRYCELDEKRNVVEGQYVPEGTLIGTIGRNNKGRGMLHLEMYRGDRTGPFSQPGNKKYDNVAEKSYQRRRDLMDPTEHLDRWKLFTDWSRYSCQPASQQSEAYQSVY